MLREVYFMDHPEGAGYQRADRVDFNRRVRLEFRGTQLSSDGGLLVMQIPHRMHQGDPRPDPTMAMDIE